MSMVLDWDYTQVRELLPSPMITIAMARVYDLYSWCYVEDKASAVAIPSILYHIIRSELSYSRYFYSRYLLPLLLRSSYSTPATCSPSLLYSTPTTKILLLHQE